MNAKYNTILPPENQNIADLGSSSEDETQECNDLESDFQPHVPVIKNLSDNIDNLSHSRDCKSHDDIPLSELVSKSKKKHGKK